MCLTVARSRHDPATQALLTAEARRRHHLPMAFTSDDTVRARTLRLLTTSSRPLTVTDLADHLNTTTNQAARALRELVRQGAAVRETQPGRPGRRGGRAPSYWRAG
jgi:predicted ArsR family transcriptional regulator